MYVCFKEFQKAKFRFGVESESTKNNVYQIVSLLHGFHDYSVSELLTRMTCKCSQSTTSCIYLLTIFPFFAMSYLRSNAC